MTNAMILWAVFFLSAAEPSEFVYVCEDAGAGGYEAFPDVCRLNDGRLMSVFYAGWKHVSLSDADHPKGGRICAAYSSDEGRTWSSASVVYDGPDDDRDPSVVQLKDGRILVNFFSLRAKDGGGWNGLGTWLVESADGGKGWSQPRQLSADYYCSAPIRELSTGALVLGLYRANEGDANGAVILSKDKGSTWSAPVNIDNGGLRLDAETDVIELRDGRLYAAQRTSDESMRYSESVDGGATWSVSKPMGFPGHAPYLFRVSTGEIVCAHRKPHTSMHVSADECRTWGDSVLIDEVGGAYPSMAALEDGTTLVVYYEEGAGSSIRAKRFSIRDGAVIWHKW